MLFRKDIEGFRGISVIYVILYHYFPKYFNGGIFGVDFFFVISGYVITKSLNIKRISILSFYQKRINRIFPAAYACLCWIYYFKYFIKTINLLKDMYSAVLFIANIRFYKSSLNYFSNVNSLILHFWSLSIENQFYLIYPLLIKLSTNILFSVLRLLLLLSFFHYYNNSKYFSEYAYFSSLTRIWEIISGCIVASVYNKYENISNYIKIAFNRISLIILITLCFIGDNFFKIPGLYTIVPVLISSIICFNSIQNDLSTIFTNSLLRYFGRISYSLYLYHYPVKLMNIELYYRLILTFILSIASYIFVEQIFIRIHVSYFVYFFTVLLIIVIILYNINHKINNLKKEIVSLYISSKKCKWVRIKFSKMPRLDCIKYLFLGDSHMLMYYDSLKYIYNGLGFHFIHYFWTIYYHKLEIINIMLRKFQNLNTIIVSYLFKLSIYNISKYKIESVLYNYFNMLQEKAKSIVFIEDIPFLSFNPIVEIDKGNKMFKIGINATRVWLNIKNSNVIVLDPFSSLCSTEMCNLLYKNATIYRDTDHINYENEIINKVLTDYFSKELKLSIKCDNISLIYKIEMREYRFMNNLERIYCKQNKIQLLHHLRPTPLIFHL